MRSRELGHVCLVVLTLALCLSCTERNPAFVGDDDASPGPPPGDGEVFAGDGADRRGGRSTPSHATRPDTFSRAPDGLSTEIFAGGGRDTGEACDGCVPQTCYRDADSDGFGASDQSVQACLPPPGYVTVDGDCDDKQVDVHPGQTAFFKLPIGLSLGFDYNCDGIEQREHPDKASCKRVGTGCEGDGWSLYIPVCGLGGLFVTCWPAGAGCSKSYGLRVQACR